MFTRTGRLPGEGFYSQIPNHWIRDHRLTAMEFKLLCFWASHEVGYRVTIKQTIAEVREGRDAIYRAVAGLVDHGYLIRSQARTGEPVGRGGSTKFAQVDYELGPAALEQTYERNWGRGPKPQVEPHPEIQEAVGDDSVPAGETASGFSVNGSAVNGKADTKKNNLLEDQKTPPPPSSSKAATRRRQTPEPVAAEGDSPTKDQDPFVGEVLAAAPHWSRRTLAEALAEPDMLDRARREPVAFRAAVLAVATGRYGHTASPRRLLEAGPWWADAHGIPRQPSAPPSPQAKACGCLRGLILVEEIVDGVPTGKDRPQPCPVCSPAAVAA